MRSRNVAFRPEQIIIQVKGGKTGVMDVRDLRGVIYREKAAIGILISLRPATGPMESEAASVGFYEHKLTHKKYPRLQLRTVKDLMEGKGIERPSGAGRGGCDVPEGVRIQEEARPAEGPRPVKGPRIP